MANEFIARKGLIVLTNGAKITGSFSVSSDSIFNGPVTASAGATGSFTGSFRGDGSALTGLVTDLRISGSTGSDTLSLLTDTLALSGSNGVTTVVTNNTVTIGIPTGTVSASSQVDHNATTNYVANQHIDHTTVSITAGSGLSGGGTIAATRTLTLDTSSAHFLDGVKKELNTEGVVSSSAQIDVRNTTGIATIATTGSNTFTGIQTISNTTNSTAFNNGALIVQGGVGIAKDVNISGSLNVTGLLTAVSMSTQYVTSSTYNVGVSKIILNDDDNVRFAGISINDSGSTNATASIFWDGMEHRFIYENLSGSNYNSAILIAGPKNTGTLGNEASLTAGRVPVATGADHIDTNAASSSIYIDFANRKTFVEAGLYVTGSVTSSVGFSGDGSNLTGIVTNLNITGSDGGTGTVSLKTQALTVDGTNGLTATVSGQTITISGSDATTSTKGVAQFNGTHFTVTGGAVSSNDITINGTTVNLGGTRNITLQQITTQGATSSDQVTFNGGAIIHGVLFTSASNTDVDTGTEVVATVVTGSYDAAFFDYVVKKGSSYRAGTVTAVWEAGTSNVEFTDVSTNDIGNTADVSLSVDLLSATARLKATVTSDNWIVKTSVRAL